MHLAYYLPTLKKKPLICASYMLAAESLRNPWKLHQLSLQIREDYRESLDLCRATAGTSVKSYSMT